MSFLGRRIQPPSSCRTRLDAVSHVRCRHRVPCSSRTAAVQDVPRLNPELDDKLSYRKLDLDPSGYFIVKLDRDTNTIVAEHYTNTINKNGVACDPETGKPIPCTPGYVRQPSSVYRGTSAKDLSVQIIEQGSPPLTRLEHANYLGREFQRAEFALLNGTGYIQD